MSKILVVDDEPVVVDIVERYLERQNHSIIISTDGSLALGFLKSAIKIDLVLVDLKMPRVSGIEVMKEAYKSDIPCIAMTGGIGVEMPQLKESLKELHYNMNELFYKPLDFKKLVDTINRKLIAKSSGL